MSSTRGVDPALASSKGGLITTSRAAFVLFVGAFTLWKVHSQQIYEKVGRALDLLRSISLTPKLVGKEGMAFLCSLANPRENRTRSLG